MKTRLRDPASCLTLAAGARSGNLVFTFKRSIVCDTLALKFAPLNSFESRNYSMNTELTKKVCPRLRELAPGLEAGSRNLGLTFLAISVLRTDVPRNNEP